ncbi:MAG: polyphosphate polymerase domain-containing protein [Lachnospiraceae bacterium]|nr:polyphosphate polymerase domain-containing protein [Lachnospiraceae bacterium]
MAAQTVFKRYEKKYLLTRDQEAEFLKKISGRMELDKYGECTICNIYFDSPDFDLIRNSIEKPIYKEKLRLRTYGVPKDGDHRAFVEIKKKFDGIVYKRRAEMSLSEAEDYLYRGIHPKKDSQILRELDWFLKTNDVQPAVYLAYDRRAYAGIQEPEFRLTLDRNIRARYKQLKLTDGSVGERVIPEDVTLMEIKIPGAMPFWMSRILSDMSIFPVSISKYGEFYKTHPELYMSAVNNHKKYLDTANDVVVLDSVRSKKAQAKHKAGV